MFVFASILNLLGYRPISAPQSKLAKDYKPGGKDGPYQITEEQTIDESEMLELHAQGPSVSHSSGQRTERESNMSRVGVS